MNFPYQFRQRLAYAAALYLLWGFSAVAQTSTSATVHRYAHSGVASPIMIETAFLVDLCTPQAVEITFIEQPKNGIISVRDEMVQIPKSTLRHRSTGTCAGKSIFGKHIYYQSNPGFRGTDQLVYEVVTVHGRFRTPEPRRTQIDITVK